MGKVNNWWIYTYMVPIAVKANKVCITVIFLL